MFFERKNVPKTKKTDRIDSLGLKTAKKKETDSGARTAQPVSGVHIKDGVIDYSPKNAHPMIGV